MSEQSEHELARQLAPGTIVEGYLKTAFSLASATATVLTTTTAEMYVWQEVEGDPDDDWLPAGDNAVITVKNIDETLSGDVGNYCIAMWTGRSFRPLWVGCSATALTLPPP